MLCLGVFGVVDRMLRWRSCMDGPTPAGIGATEECLDAMSFTTRHEMIGSLWLAALLLAAAALVLARGYRWAGAVALVLVVAVNPLTDPGFFWQGWDTADTVPGTGVLPAVAIIVSGGVFVLRPRTPRHAVRPGTPAGPSTPGQAESA